MITCGDEGGDVLGERFQPLVLVGAAVREGGFDDGEVLRMLHVCVGDGDGDGDGDDDEQQQQQQALPIHIPAPPSYPLANILFQLQGLRLTPPAHALLILLGVSDV